MANVWVLTEGRPMAERRAAPRRPFYQQTLLIESNIGPRGRPVGIAFDLSPQELDALRDRHGMDDHAPWVLLEYYARTKGSDAPARHLSFLHCTFRLVTFVGQVSACLRDGDGDGRLDGAVTIRGGPIPPEGRASRPSPPFPTAMSRATAAGAATRARTISASLTISTRQAAGWCSASS